jgi:hypothetical protein
MRVCPQCGYVEKNRSTDISTHFHGHVTQIARETGDDRELIYHRVLLLACEIETEGGAEYPYSIIDGVLYPHRTSACTNKEMMTAVEAAHRYAALCGVWLNEREPW